MSIDRQALAAAFEGLRPALVAYLTRMVVRLDVAEELAQTTAVRALEHLDSAPPEADRLRRWLFRIATNLALDERKRHGSWRETLMQDLKDSAKRNPAHQDRLAAAAGSPELRSIAREHLSFCFACTLGRLPGEQAAVLLLREAWGFDRKETADILGIDPVRVKNRLQEARRATRAAYRDTCALVTKRGACYQCAELDEMFGTGEARDPLDGASDRLEGRLRVVREQPAGTWTRWLSELLAALDGT